MATIDRGIRKRDLAWMTAMILVATTIWVVRGDTARGGEGPPGDGIDVVYVAVGTGFPDALGVGPGAGVNSAPIILVPTNPPLNGATTNELVRLDPKHVVIVGGTTVISQATEEALEALLPNATFERIAGANRYETNALFSEAIYPVESWASIGAAGFTGLDPATDTVVVSGAYVWNSSDGALQATIQLPHGATILGFELTGFDNTGDTNVGAWLYRYDENGDATQVAFVASFGSPGTFSTTSTAIESAAEVVDNDLYSYTVLVSGALGTAGVSKVSVRYRLGTP